MKICNFQSVFITLIDFVRFMSTIINYEHIVWSACDGTINGKVFRISIFSLSLNRVLN